MKADENNFEKRLHKWADETADFYHNLAVGDKGYDLSFYTQSDLTKVGEQPDVLILGINPGSGGTYQNQIQNKKWETKDGRIVGKILLKGNPCFTDRDRWTFWRGLKRIFGFAGMSELLDDEKRFASSNIVFFSTSNQSQINERLFNLCLPKTLELIKILQPKHIVCLSINSCFNRLDIKERQVVIPSYLVKGRLGDIPIYGIRHTSYPNLGELVVGKCLHYLFEQEPEQMVDAKEISELFSEDIKNIGLKRPNLSREEATQVKDLTVERLQRKWHLYDKPHNRFEIVHKKLSLTITDTERGYAAIRFMDSNNRPETDEIIKILNKYGFKHYESKNELIWLGTKKFKLYGSNPEEIVNNMITELEAIVAELDKLMIG